MSFNLFDSNTAIWPIYLKKTYPETRIIQLSLESSTKYLSSHPNVSLLVFIEIIHFAIKLMCWLPFFKHLFCSHIQSDYVELWYKDKFWKKIKSQLRKPVCLDGQCNKLIIEVTQQTLLLKVNNKRSFPSSNLLNWY